jgi:hypothetical protein
MWYNFWGQITGTLDVTVGNVTIPVWIVNKAGNAPNKFNITLTQT